MHQSRTDNGHQGAPSAPRHSGRRALTLAILGIASSLVVGPIAVYTFGEITGVWFWTLTLGSLVNGASGVVLGVLALKAARKEFLYGNMSPAKILGIIAISGGCVSLTIFFFYLMIIGIMWAI